MALVGDARWVLEAAVAGELVGGDGWGLFHFRLFDGGRGVFGLFLWAHI
jgi:hypothetical protein